VRAVAQRHGVRANLLSYWRRRQRALGESKDFAAMQTATPAPAAAVGREFDAWRDYRPTVNAVVRSEAKKICSRVIQKIGYGLTGRP